MKTQYTVAETELFVAQSLGWQRLKLFYLFRKTKKYCNTITVRVAGVLSLWF